MDIDMAPFILFYLVGPTMGFTNFRFGQCSCHLSLSKKFIICFYLDKSYAWILAAQY